MENFETEGLKQYTAFNAAIRDRVNRIAAEEKSTIRSAQAVVERLFSETESDPSMVTDEAITHHFREIDAQS